MFNIGNLFTRKKVEVSWLKEYQQESNKLYYIKEELGKLINTETNNLEVLDILYKIREIIYKN